MKKTPAPAASPSAALDPRSLKKALSDLDKLQAGIVEMKASVATYQSFYDRLIANGDPNDPNVVKDVSAARTRLEMWPNYIRKNEAGIAPALDNLLAATRAFDVQLIAAGQAEQAALREAIAAKVEPVLAPILAAHGMNAGRAAALVANSFAGLQHIPQDAAVLQDNADPDYMVGLKDARWFGRPAVRQAHGADAQGDVQNLQAFESILRGRVAALLSAYAVYEANGGKWVPADPEASEPVFVVRDNIFKPQPTYRFSQAMAASTPDGALNLGGGSLGGTTRPDDLVPAAGSLGGYLKGPGATRAAVTSTEASGPSKRAAAAPATTADGAPVVDLQAFVLTGADVLLPANH